MKRFLLVEDEQIMAKNIAFFWSGKGIGLILLMMVKQRWSCLPTRNMI
ncbi:MAG TPA: hypothetical protein VFC74_00200 [Oscillospiraceae bacterium]|nr:hypothetical protein [Oscillospiraceae bacterium]